MRAVINFHAIDDQPGPLSFAPERFRALVRALVEAELPVVDLGSLLSGKTDHGVVLTFDDGMASVHSHAMPVLAEYGLPAHLFLTTGYVAGSNHWPTQPAYAQHYDMLDWKQLEQLSAAGMLIEGHTASHPDLRLISDAEIADEFAASNQEVEARLGRRPRFFAYPYGHYDRRVRQAASAVYEACCTTELRYLPDNVERDAVPRLDSFYLQSPMLMRNLGHPATRAYVALRNMIRKVRGRT